jgi:hypothetical protein
MTGVKPDVNISEVRKLLGAAFTARELRHFCQDCKLFRPVLQQVSGNPTTADIVDAIIDYTLTKIYWEELLAEIKKANPRQYARFEPRLYHMPQSTSRPEPEPDKDPPEVEYVASRKSDKFHESGCRSIKLIKPENRLRFSDRAAAVQSGKVPCHACLP